MQESAKEFEKQDAELIFVFREESKGVEGLKLIQKRVPTTKYTLAIDRNKKSSAAYASERGSFDNYVIDKEGNVAAILDGTKMKRASAKQLFEVLEKLNK